MPTLLLSAALVAGSIVTGVMTRPKADVGAMLAKAEEAVTREEYDSALEYLNTKVRPYLDGGVLTPEQAQDFHVLRARAVALAERQLGVKVPENAEQIVAELAAAEELGAKLDAKHMLMIADARVTLGQDQVALKIVRELPEEEKAGRAQIVKRVVERSIEDEKADPVASLRLLAEMIASGELAGRDRAWALARQGELLLKQNMPDGAVARLVQTMPGVVDDADEDTLGDLYHILGRAYFESDALTDAARELERAARQYRESDPRWAKVQSLLGRVDELLGDAPRARQRYIAVLDRVTEPSAMPGPLLGLAEVRASLGDFEESIKDYERLIQLLEKGTTGEGITRSKVSKSLMERHRTRLATGDVPLALRYAELAERVIGSGDVPPEVLLAIATSQRRSAEQLLAPLEGSTDRMQDLARLDPATREQARLHLVTAGRYFKSHAESLGTSDNEGYGDSLWRAAESMDMAGDQDLSIPLLNDFVRFFPADRRQAEARFRLGQAYQARGDYGTAIEQYAELVNGAGNERGENSAFADRAMVPLARCYLLDGEASNDAEAERILQSVVSGRGGAAGGERYRDALVELARMKQSRGEWASAIQLLEEAVERFTDSPDIDAARYALAESLRQDAGAIQRTLTEAMPDQQRLTLTRTRGERLNRAIELYDKVRVSLDRKDPRRLTRLERLQLRNAYFYLGDCAFELREFDEAIRRYDAARERYAQDPASLVGMVQIVNAYVELGDMERARTAQARAKRFYDSIPAAAWSDPDLPMGKEAWQRWLNSMEAMRSTGEQAQGRVESKE